MLAVGFLIGMIPAMLLIGFWGGRQIEKQRKEMKLQYDRQITALRATIQRLMQRIDLLSDEGQRLKNSNRSLRESINDKHRHTDVTSAELKQLKDQNERLTAEKLRQEGKLEEARIQQERMAAQFSLAVSQFTDAERLRQHLLFATHQLRAAQALAQTAESAPENLTSNMEQFEDPHSSPADLDVAVIEDIEALYVERLYDSGIHTVADLADQTPARVAHFAGLSSWDESTSWIAEAKSLMVDVPQNRS